MSSSYIFPGVNSSVSALNEALDRIGGGDAKISNMEVHCLISDCDDDKVRDRQVLWTGSSSLGIRNIDLPPSTPVAQCMKYFEITSACTLIKRGCAFLDTIPHEHLFRWVSDGFNGSMITYGERNSLKTTVMFGRPVLEDDIHDPEYPPCVALCILQNLYAIQSEQLTIGLSCWSLKGNELLDLLDVSGQKSENTDEFLSVECPNLSVALTALKLARSRCQGALSNDEGAINEAERAHFFLRITVHRSDNRGAGRVSYLHLIDLVGAAPTGDISHGRLPENDRMARRTMSVQFSTLGKVLKEMREVSLHASKQRDLEGTQFVAEMKMTSARESKLTMILAPLLQGNSKTLFLCFLKDGERHYQASMNTLKMIEGVVNIKTACHRVQNVPIGNLHLTPYRNVLPPQYSTRRQLGSSPPPQGRASGNRNGIANAQPSQDVRSSFERYEVEKAVLSMNGYDDNDQIPMRQIDDNFQNRIHENHDGTVPASNDQNLPRFDALMREFNSFKESHGDLLSSADSPSGPRNKFTSNQYHYLDGSGEGPPPAPPLSMRSSAENHPPNQNHGSDDIYVPQMPLYYDLSGSYPIEELMKSALNEDVVWNSQRFNSLRQSYDLQNQNMEEYNTADAINQEVRRQLESMKSNVLDYPADLRSSVENEFSKPHLSNQGQRMKSTYGSLDSFSLNVCDDKHGADEQTYQASSVEGPILLSDPTSESHEPLDFPVSSAMSRRFVEETMNASKERGERSIEPAEPNTKEAKESDAQIELLWEGPDIHIQNLNESLVNAVRRENRNKQKLEEHFETMKLNFQEEKEKLELQVEDLKLECSKLRQLMRRMASDASLEDVLHFFEEEMKLLASENTSLRKRNLFLESHNDYLTVAEEPDREEHGVFADVDESRMDVMTAGSRTPAIKEARTPDHTANHSTRSTPLSLDASSKKIKKSLSTKDITWTSMDGMTSSSGTENAEIRVLKASLRKAKKEWEEMSSKMDNAKRIERRGHMSIKMYEDCSKKLSRANSDLERLSKEVDFERETRFQRENDIATLRAELQILQTSERELRSERSRTLSELAGARQRVRELEIQRSETASFDRFVAKHTASKWGIKKDGAASSGPKTAAKNELWGNGKSTAQPATKQQSNKLLKNQNIETLDSTKPIINESNEHLIVSSFDTPGMASRILMNKSALGTTPNAKQAPAARSSDPGGVKSSPPPFPMENQANSKSILKLSGNNKRVNAMNMTDNEAEEIIARGVVGVAGLSNAQYLRLEETEPLSPAVEQSLLALHDIIALTSPNLLPLVGKLGTDLKAERAMSVQQRAAMLAQMQKHQYAAARKDYA